MGSNSGSKLESLHTLIAASKQDADYVTLSAAGCPDLKKNLVVAHLDDNPLNFSIENLTWVSSKMNHWCKKSTQVREQTDGRYMCQFKFDGRSRWTALYTTKDEAIFARDVMKVLIPSILTM